MGFFLCFLDDLAWSFSRASRVFRFCFSTAACLDSVRTLLVQALGEYGRYLFATFAASETAARAWLRPAEAVTVSGASSELFSSFSASTWSLRGANMGESSILVDEGTVFGGLRSSLPYFLWAAFGGFGVDSVVGVALAGSRLWGFLRSFVTLPFFDCVSKALGVTALEVAAVGGRTLGDVSADLEVARPEMPSF